MFRAPNKIVSQRRGFSLVEVLIASVLLILLSLITVTGMMFHARMAQSNLSKQRIAEQARRLVDAAQIAAMDATIIRVDDGPAGADTVLTLGRPDAVNPGNVVYKQYAYLDDDGSSSTIRDNRIVERDVNDPTATTGDTLVSYCSPVAGEAVFAQDPAAPYALYEINLRVGDKTNPPSAEDDGITGKGFQSFLIRAQLSKN